MNISELLYHILLKPISKLPLSILHRFSDILKYLLKDVLKYRVGVVEQNLKKAFPNWTEEELSKTIKAFYAHLSDLIVEGVKSFSISEEEIKSRVNFLNPEVFDAYSKANRSVLILSSHCDNWEWPSIVGPCHLPYDLYGFYKTIKNETIEQALRKSRSQLGLILSSIEFTYKSFVEREGSGQAYAYLMLGDQSPIKISKAHWIDFLGIDTACHHGPAHYAQTYNLPIFYVHISKVKRGYYDVVFEEIVSDPKSIEAEKITAIYMKTLEASILKNPVSWLWSHKRWKHKRELNS